MNNSIKLVKHQKSNDLPVNDYEMPDEDREKELLKAIEGIDDLIKRVDDTIDKMLDDLKDENNDSEN